MISRRTLLRTTASLVPVALLTGPGAAWAQQKSPKKAAQYQEQPKDGQQCSQCRFFIKPGGCQIVQGDISPQGWCSLFQPKA